MEKQEYLFQLGNVDALSNAIIELIKNPALLQKMKNNIKEINTSGINSWKIIADNYYLFINNKL